MASHVSSSDWPALFRAFLIFLGSCLVSLKETGHNRDVCEHLAWVIFLGAAARLRSQSFKRRHQQSKLGRLSESNVQEIACSTGPWSGAQLDRFEHSALRRVIQAIDRTPRENLRTSCHFVGHSTLLGPAHSMNHVLINVQ